MPVQDLKNSTSNQELNATTTTTTTTTSSQAKQIPTPTKSNDINKTNTPNNKPQNKMSTAAATPISVPVPAVNTVGQNAALPKPAQAPVVHNNQV